MRNPLRGPVHREIPAGDNRERLVCHDCGFIAYENPKVVVGSVVHARGQVLLCRRAIEPRRGFWTIPAGFMEVGETAEEGAAREAAEEALANIQIRRLLAVYSVARIGQVQLIYDADLLGDQFGVGEESLEVQLFDWDDIPWTELAFPTVDWSLRDARSVFDRTDYAPFTAGAT